MNPFLDEELEKAHEVFDLERDRKPFGRLFKIKKKDSIRHVFLPYDEGHRVKSGKTRKKVVRQDKKD